MSFTRILLFSRRTTHHFLGRRRRRCGKQKVPITGNCCSKQLGPKKGKKRAKKLCILVLVASNIMKLRNTYLAGKSLIRFPSCMCMLPKRLCALTSRRIPEWVTAPLRLLFQYFNIQHFTTVFAHIKKNRSPWTVARCPAILQHGYEVEELPVKVSNNLDRSLEFESVGFRLENFQRLPEKNWSSMVYIYIFKALLLSFQQEKAYRNRPQTLRHIILVHINSKTTIGALIGARYQVPGMINIKSMPVTYNKW